MPQADLTSVDGAEGLAQGEIIEVTGNSAVAKPAAEIPQEIPQTGDWWDYPRK